MRGTKEIFDTLAHIADDPNRYVSAWKAKHGRKAIGIFPMNFPAELVHAAGALPVLVQESPEPITLGRSLIFEFYCGYTRSLTDQAATQKLDAYDAFFIVDHCVALIGAVDAMRYEMPEKPIFMAQFVASMDEAWTPPEIRKQIDSLRARLEEFCGIKITDDALLASIRSFNRNRQLLRQIYDLRRAGTIRITAAQLQVLVKSSMVMDIDEHSALLSELIPHLEREAKGGPRLVKLHLSGHFCHAPPPALLDMIESCGSIVVDDDLFTGYRYISSDVSEAGDPAEALVRVYFDRNTKVPCSALAQKSVDWETYLVHSLEKSGAEGIIILMVKFCEPHMLYYPELRKELDRRNIPHLLIETEHEGLPLESLRTRVEALLERIRRSALAAPAMA